MTQKSVEQKYRKLDDIDHCLERPGMWVGSIKPRSEEMYVFDQESIKMIKKEITYNPAFLKIFDEIISNSVDESKRNKKLNFIEVKIDKELNKISIFDNGGMPVVKHSEYNEWIPELVFSNLKAGSNFDDTDERLVAGTNGVGSTLTNIFSKEFSISTCDNNMIFRQTFSNNMRERTVAKTASCSQITKSTKYKIGHTEISYIPDLQRFNMTEIDEDHIKLFEKRCIDIAACNRNLEIKFNNISFKFKKFYDYIKLFSDNPLYEQSNRWEIGVTESDGSLNSVSFVNSVETKDGGTHVDYILNQIVEFLIGKIKSKHKFDLKPSEIKPHIKLFVCCEIVNPAFSSQTKEKLITLPSEFGSKFTLSEQFLKSVYESEVVSRVLDWVNQKVNAEENKKIRELNKLLDKTKILKLIDAKNKDRQNCSLCLFEGESAISAFRQHRDPSIQGGYPLRGKFLNVSEMKNVDIIKNQEVKDIIGALGLKLGDSIENMRYNKILIYSDADPDGDSIACLVMNFLAKYWPQLFEQKKVHRVITPLVVVKNKSQKLLFYTNEEFNLWKNSVSDLTKWDISYKKGLAALHDAEYKEIIQNPKTIILTPGDNIQQTFYAWFGPDANERKKRIMKNNN